MFFREVNLDAVGADLPVRELGLLDIGPDGAMGALRRQDHDVFDKVLMRLGCVGWASLAWGEDDSGSGGSGLAPGDWSRIRAEGSSLWPLMEPGKVMTSDGTEMSGISPSGARRGDRFITAYDERLSRTDEAWCTLRLLHAKMEALGTALGARLRSMRLRGCSDSIFACFPGGGAKYNSHVSEPSGKRRRRLGGTGRALCMHVTLHIARLGLPRRAVP